MDIDIKRSKRLKQVIEHIVWSGKAFSRKEIANKIGCSTSTLYNMYSARSAVNIQKVFKLCSIYKQYNAMFIFYGKEPMLNEPVVENIWELEHSK